MSSKKLFFLFSLLCGLAKTNLPAKTIPSTHRTQPARLSAARLQAAKKMLRYTPPLSPEEYQFQQKRRQEFPLLPRANSSHYRTTPTNNSHFGPPSYTRLLTPKQTIPFSQPQKPTSKRASQETSAVTVDVFVPGGLKNPDSEFFKRLFDERAQRTDEESDASFEIVSIPTTDETKEPENITAPTTHPSFLVFLIRFLLSGHDGADLTKNIFSFQFCV